MEMIEVSAFYYLLVYTENEDTSNRATYFNCDKWIVVTSINNATSQIDRLSKLNGFKLLVVGDKKTHPYWSYENVIYLSVDTQRSLGFKSFKNTPFNSYTRKNIGYLYAIQNGAKYIYDTDDDNAPIYNLETFFDIDKTTKYGMVIDRSTNTKSESTVINPYAHFGQPTIWPRGYPLTDIHINYNNNYICGLLNVSIVQQGLVNGDPDVDAIFRLTKTMNYKKPNITFDSTSPSLQIPPFTFTPYNSQNTMFHYNAFWSLYLPKTVTFRLTDIWRSYWSQRLMWLIGATVSFYGPNAVQVRNSHSYLMDFEEEQDMYVKTENLLKFLTNWYCEYYTFFKCVLDLSQKMADNNFWSNDEVTSIKDWLNDLTSFGYKEPKMTDYIRQVQIIDTNTDYFRVRYTPIYQNSLDIDNYGVNDPSGMTKRFHAYKFFENVCNKSKSFDDISTKYLITKSKPIGNYALLITFNWEPNALVIEFIKNFYGSYFRVIVFCGKNILNILNNAKGSYKQFDSFTFIDLDTVNGHFHYNCMTKMIEMNLNVDGILLMSDDVMLKYWNLDRSLNLNKIWFSENFYCSLEVRLNNTKSWIHWNSNEGAIAVVKMWEYFGQILNEHTHISETKEFLINYLSNLELKYDKKSDFAKVCQAGSDVFYIPKLFYKKFHFISSTFRRFNVFLEIAVPTILAGLITNQSDYDIIKGKYEWNDPWISFQMSYKPIEHFYHPIKLSRIVLNDSMNQEFCNYFIRDKFFYDFNDSK